MAKREHDEHAPPLIGSAYGPKTALALRMGCIGKNGERTRKKAFNS